jgi:hypothetical protein
MRPEISRVFQTFAMDLMARVIPEITPAYHQGTIGMIAAMLLIAADEWDRGASRRFEENARLRELFAGAAAAVTDITLRDRIAALAGTRDDDLRVSALEQNNCALRAALIDLHAHVEALEGAAARRVEDQIWRELAKSTERRMLSTAPF